MLMREGLNEKLGVGVGFRSGLELWVSELWPKVGFSHPSVGGPDGL